MDWILSLNGAFQLLDWAKHLAKQLVIQLASAETQDYIFANHHLTFLWDCFKTAQRKFRIEVAMGQSQ